MTVTQKNELGTNNAVETASQGVVHDINMSQQERIVSLISGGAMTVFGLSRRNLVGTLLALLGGEAIYSGVTGHSHLYQALGLNSAITGWSDMVSVPHDQGIHLRKAVLINKSPEELYAFWRNFENLPRFMDHIDSVTVTDNKHSHWVAKAPAGMKVEWDAEIINEIPNELIAWRSLDGAQVPNAGSVRFIRAPYGRGTELKVQLEYAPPAGKVGAMVARMFGENPEQQIREDLRHFKQIMESGEFATNKAQASGPMAK